LHLLHRLHPGYLADLGIPADLADLEDLAVLEVEDMVVEDRVDNMKEELVDNNRNRHTEDKTLYN
jgi:hypothetical protein